MRTARFICRLGEGVVCPGVCVCPGCVCVQGVFAQGLYTPSTQRGDTHCPLHARIHPPNRMTDRCKNITCPPLHLRAVTSCQHTPFA